MSINDTTFPDWEPIRELSLASCYIASQPRAEKLMLMALPEGSRASGIFTRNAMQAAPVTVAQRHLAETQGRVRYVLVNAGNANAATGSQGIEATLECCRAVANYGGVQVNEVLPFSTGVIGEPLGVTEIVAALPLLFEGLAVPRVSKKQWFDAAQAILTTDTRTKLAGRKWQCSDEVGHLIGFAKGSGMICPDMATMLAFMVTNVACESAVLDKILAVAATKSFNRITVDGDMSTNDACLLIATGKASGKNSPETHYAHFAKAVDELSVHLAQAIVRDGEGASKFIEIEVRRANNRDEALQVAYQVAHSPLVKTALAASDPNWGRIISAVGSTKLDQLDMTSVAIDINGVAVVRNASAAPDYSEEQGQAALQPEEIHIVIDLGRGKVSETIWTTDLTEAYVEINAGYRS